jgi:predicted ArsR family transcriptional regulator
MYKAADPLNARLAEYAYTIIRNDILAGRFGPGGRLVQDELARRLGISRTPVREAIVRLEQEDLATLIPRHARLGQRHMGMAPDRDRHGAGRPVLPTDRRARTGRARPRQHGTLIVVSDWWQ